ncbi:MAG TPA: arylesterase [Nitrospiria bacterium]|nr:arylesterase [Nitrospiria bacterium]
MRAIPWLISMILIIPIAGTVESRAEFPIREKKVIVAFGDSLTAGFGVKREESYPALLQQKLSMEGYPYKVINAGISGDTTSGGLSRIGEILKLKPDIVILELGANDGLRGVSLEIIRHNLSEMVARLQKKKIKVLLAGMQIPPNYGEDYAGGFHQIFKDLSRTFSISIIPFFLEGTAGDPALNQGDDIHPTADGYKVVLGNVWPHLLPLLTRS